MILKKNLGSFWRGGSLTQLPNQALWYSWNYFVVTCKPPTHDTYVPEKAIEGRKSDLLFSWLTVSHLKFQ